MNKHERHARIWQMLAGTRKVPVTMRTHYARVALIRHTTDPGKPETRLCVDVIVQAIADAIGHRPSREAREFLQDWRIDLFADLCGLPPAYAREVAQRAGAV